MLLAALPVAVLVGSPQRVALSALIAGAYVAGVAFTMRGQRLDRILVAYIGIVAAWMLVSWLRSTYLLHLQPDQLSYATAKTTYFVLIVLPMAAAVALMVGRAEAIWPTATAQVAIGAGVAVLTVVLLGEHFLGAQRYSWQGNLIALATVVALQPWPIARLRASVAIGVLGVFGVGLASSRQAAAALAAALIVSAVFWALAGFRAHRRYVLLALGLVALLAAFIAVTYAADRGMLPLPGAGTASAATSCNCLSDRIISLEASPGDRDKMLVRGVQLFLSNPVLGAGVGSFAGAVPDSLQAGHFYEYPHNALLEVASETGLVGVILIFAPLFAGWAVLFWSGVRSASGPIAAVLMLLAVFFTVAMVSGDLPSERGLWIFGIVAFKLGVDRLRAPQRDPPQ